jgi:hypothetical protein
VHGNPILLIDPDGRSAQSPIYDGDGNFLGTDSEGFTGDVVVMKASTYNGLTGNGSKTLDHQFVSNLVENGVFANNFNEAGLSLEGMSNILTHVTKQMEGDVVEGDVIQFDRLEGGIINIVNQEYWEGEDGFGYEADVGKFGNPNQVPGTAVAAETKNAKGGINVSVRLRRKTTGMRSVETIQSTLGVHEYYAHGVRDLKNSNHPQIYRMQINHSRTFDKLKGHEQDLIRERSN